MKCFFVLTAILMLAFGESKAQGFVVSPSFGLSTNNVSITPRTPQLKYSYRTITGATTLGMEICKQAKKRFKYGLSYLFLYTGLNQMYYTGKVTINTINIHSIGMFGAYNLCGNCKFQPFLYASPGLMIGYPANADLFSYERMMKLYLDLQFGANYHFGQKFSVFGQGGIGRSQLRFGVTYVLRSVEKKDEQKGFSTLHY